MVDFLHLNNTLTAQFNNLNTDVLAVLKEQFMYSITKNNLTTVLKLRILMKKALMLFALTVSLLMLSSMVKINLVVSVIFVKTLIVKNIPLVLRLIHCYTIVKAINLNGYSFLNAYSI